MRKYSLKRRARPSWRAFVAMGVAALVALGAFAAIAGARSLAVPSTTSPPTIEGSPIVGQTVTAGNGGWANAPTAYAYQWQRCDQSGAGCVAIGGATARSYTIVAADGGHTLVVLVTASNASGKSTANSHPSATVATSGAAQFSARPTISGQAIAGQELTADKGTWNSATNTWSYQWQRCDQNGANCANASGATGSSYGVRTADAGRTLRVAVTGSGTAGAATSTSDRTAVVQAIPVAAASTDPCATLAPGAASTPVSATDLALPNRLLIDHWTFAPSLVTASTRTVTARIHISDSCGRSVAGATVGATAIPFNQVSEEVAPTGSDGWATLNFQMLAGYPANPGRQQLLAMLVHAAKPNGSTLGGISTNRALRLNLNLRG